ncbi:glycoside hydrolase family 43 protein [Superficieibacter electus]|uniref:glycoside hydrolase family 43 protein n=1 Tax=Superficieibacter electus TaxID=2022662 RepID=UPI001C40845C|nr:glycoside hydrolase family 43 protein [Superficieibacter electus]
MTITVKNPLIEGWYADPEIRFYAGQYWIYVTRSFTDYKQQLNIDAFSSPDLVHWEKHAGIVEMADFPWIWRAVWAPTIVAANNRYYLIFASNDIQDNDQVGGLEIAVADSPAGPFRALLKKPLIDRFINDAQPIDAHLFADDDGKIYLYYGGWGHCNVAQMNPDMDGFIPFEDGTVFREIDIPGYVEAPCMIKRRGRYHFMWSEGNWTNGSYRAVTTASDSPFVFAGPRTTLLTAQPIADGPGHHSCIALNDEDQWLIAYHRRIPGDNEAGHRMLCLDKLIFSGETIEPVVMTDGLRI